MTGGVAGAAIALLVLAGLWYGVQACRPQRVVGRIGDGTSACAAVTAILLAVDRPAFTGVQIAFYSFVGLAHAGAALVERREPPAPPPQLPERLRAGYHAAVAASMLLAAIWTAADRPGSAFAAMVSDAWSFPRLLMVAAGAFYCLTSIRFIELVVTAVRVRVDSWRPTLEHGASLLLGLGAACVFLEAASTP